jgi:ABC-type microcin C transport system permease subunit YejB
LRLLGLALRRLAASLPALAMIIVGLFLLLQFAPGDTVDALVAQIGGGWVRSTSPPCAAGRCAASGGVCR